ncbi:MAG: hypothetical protein A3E87_05140 [Gammaproteobacteria bacterium RIFCSPHIGHO2_12_FULL_35_23]|nr:MAG: hypothetical protein A3E87_05140 [Gammaproteobacteria bacterium RIFCSPHIGHO2_12_FULL_35_23]
MKIVNKAENTKTLFKKNIIIIWDTIFCLLILPILLIVRLVISYKVVILNSSRIGHLALEQDIFLRKKQAGEINNKTHYLFLLYYQPANKQLLKMLKRKLCIIDNLTISKLLGRKKILKKFGLFAEMRVYANEYDLYINTIPSLNFTAIEIKQGESILSQLGFDTKKDKLVCIVVRDQAYLQATLPGVDFSGHKSRDADINNFIPAMEFLINQGYWVIRMGAKVEKRAAFQHERFIDYPFSEVRSDFMDIFLIYVSEFILGTSCGLCDIGQIFDKPILAVNHVPYWLAPHSKNCLYIPKKLRNICTKQIAPFYSLPQDIELSIFDHVNFSKKYNLEYIENSAAEILKATQEMFNRIKSHWYYSQIEKNMLNQYFSSFWDLNPYASMIKTPICIFWLNENMEFYDKNFCLHEKNLSQKEILKS